MADVQEIAGHGISISLDGKTVLAGNSRLMNLNHIKFKPVRETGTVVYVAEDGISRGAYPD